MAFVGVSLFLLTIIAIVAVVFVCNQQKASPSAAMGVQLSSLTTNPAPQPFSHQPRPCLHPSVSMYLFRGWTETHVSLLEST